MLRKCEPCLFPVATWSDFFFFEIGVFALVILSLWSLNLRNHKVNGNAPADAAFRIRSFVSCFWLLTSVGFMVQQTWLFLNFLPDLPRLQSLGAGEVSPSQVYMLSLVICDFWLVFFLFFLLPVCLLFWLICWFKFTLVGWSCPSLMKQESILDVAICTNKQNSVWIDKWLYFLSLYNPPPLCLHINP